MWHFAVIHPQNKVSIMNARTTLLALLATAGVSQAIAPVEAYGNLKVDKTTAKLTDSAGKPVVLRGMSFFESKHPNGGKYYNGNVVKWLATDWNVSLVRAAMGVTTESYNGGQNKGYLADPVGNQDRVERVIQGAIDAGIYVIVDWHITAETGQENCRTSGCPQEAKLFFGELAKKYGNTPNLIWELWNEPTVGWSTIASLAKTVIPEIRKYSKNPIVIGNSSWSSTPHEVGSDLDSYDNILYALHFYAAQGSHDGYKSNITSAMSKGHAVMVTEWGVSDALGGANGTINLNNAQTWLTFLDNTGVSHANWSVTDKEETCSILKPGTTNLGGWAASDLTAAGTFMRNYFITKNLHNGARFTPPDTSTRLITALKPDTVALHVNGVDTIVFNAQYNKTLTAWTLTLTGKTSGAVFTASGNLTSTVNVKWAATMKKAFTTKTFQAGEEVVATLTPAGKVPASATTTVKVLNAVGTTPRVQALEMGWNEGRITLPSTNLLDGQSVTVRLVGLDGRTLWSKSATLQDREGGATIALDRPDIRSVAILEIDGGQTRFRSKLHPRF